MADADVIDLDHIDAATERRVQVYVDRWRASRMPAVIAALMAADPPDPARREALRRITYILDKRAEAKAQRDGDGAGCLCRPGYAHPECPRHRVVK